MISRRDLVDALPPRVGLGLRSRFGGSRDPEVDLLGAFVHPGDVVVDIGANRGVYSWHLSRLVGRSGTVHAFEPQPELAEYLERALVQRPNVLVHRSALSDRSGSATLSIPIVGRQLIRGHGTLQLMPQLAPALTISVPTEQLDDLAMEPSFIKADVEGHEAAVLRGATATIQRCLPVLLLEVDYHARRGGDLQARSQLVNLLADHGYTPAYHRDGRLSSLSDWDGSADPNVHLPAELYRINWFFLPPARPPS